MGSVCRLNTSELGQSVIGYVSIAGAVEYPEDGRMRRRRLEVIEGWGLANLHPFVLCNTREGSIIMTDGKMANRRIPGRLHGEAVLPEFVYATF